MDKENKLKLYNNLNFEDKTILLLNKVYNNISVSILAILFVGLITPFFFSLIIIYFFMDLGALLSITYLIFILSVMFIFLLDFLLVYLNIKQEKAETKFLLKKGMLEKTRGNKKNG